MYSPLKVGFIARFLISRRRRSEFDDDDDLLLWSQCTRFHRVVTLHCHNKHWCGSYTDDDDKHWGTYPSLKVDLWYNIFVVLLFYWYINTGTSNELRCWSESEWIYERRQMPLCPHLTITLIIQYNLISNYDVNCDFRFREVLLGVPSMALNYAFHYDMALNFRLCIFKNPPASRGLCPQTPCRGFARPWTPLGDFRPLICPPTPPSRSALDVVKGGSRRWS